MAVSYVGGGCTEEREDAISDLSLREGSRGGTDGLAFGGAWAGAAVCDVDCSAIALCIGGGGRWSVFKPVLSARYGKGGAAGLTSSSSGCGAARPFCSAAFGSTSDKGAPSLPPLGVTSLGSATPPW